jgi:hypothetical protein
MQVISLCAVLFIPKDSLLFTCLFITVPLVQQLATHVSQKHSVHHQMSFIWKLRSHSLQLWNCNYWIFQHLYFIYEGLTWWWYEYFWLKHDVNFRVSERAINCCQKDSLSACSSLLFLFINNVHWLSVQLSLGWLWSGTNCRYVLFTPLTCLHVLTEHMNDTGVR